MRRVVALSGQRMSVVQAYFSVLAHARARTRARDDSRRGAGPGVSG
jgi:hypothetical protein